MKIEYSAQNKTCHENAGCVDYDVMGELEEGFLRLRRSDASTPLRKHLPKRLFRVLQYKSTPLGATFLDVVRLGLLRHDSATGAVLPDHLAYDTFKLLLDPILEERHLGFDPSADSQPPVDWGDWRRLHNLDPQHKFIKRVCVSASRNLDGVRFTPTMSPAELQAVENAVLLSLFRLPGEYAGNYDYIQCMTRARKEELFRGGCLFNCGDKYDHAANVPRFWSYGRGVFVNEEHTFVVWVNAKDHVRVLSMEEGGQVQKAYRRLSDVMPYLDCRLHPARHPRLGQLTVSLDDVGSGVSADAVVRLRAMPNPLLEDVAKVYHLEMCCLEGDLYMVSNRSHLGYTEFEVIKRFTHGLRELLYLASFLERSMPKDSDEYSDEDEEGEEEEDEESEDKKGKGEGGEKKRGKKKGDKKKGGKDKGRKNKRGKNKGDKNKGGENEESQDRKGKGKGGKNKRSKNKRGGDKESEDEERGDKEGKGKGGKNKRSKDKRGGDKESEDEETGDKEGKVKGGKNKGGKNKRVDYKESEDEETGDKESKGKGGKDKGGKNKRGDDKGSEDEESGDKDGKRKGDKNMGDKNERGEDNEGEVGEEGDSGNEGDDETSEEGNERNENKEG